MARHYWESSLGQIHYVSTGEGPLLLLMHTSSTSSRFFSNIIPLLENHFHVVAPDLPGFGNSDPLPNDVSIPQIADCMVAFLDEFDESTRYVFGLHTGNKIATAMGERAPDQVDRIILCAEPHSIIPDEERRDDVLRERNRKRLRGFPETPDNSHLAKNWARLHTRITDVWWDIELLDEEGFSRETFNVLANGVLDKIQARSSLTSIYDANFAYDLTTAFGQIGPKTLVLELAKEADIERYGLQGERVAALIPNGSCVSLDVATSYTFQTDPETIADEIIAFLTE